jgi:phosphomannomutase
MKKLIVFDLDGTLAKSKSALDAEMAGLLHSLIGVVKVSVISGGDWPQFVKQLLQHLPDDTELKNLSILPTCGTKFYQYMGTWKKIYSEDFSADEKETIVNSLNKVMNEADFKTGKTWGDVIEDRGSQITYSALGQEAPLAEKKNWDTDYRKRKNMKNLLDNLLPGFSVAIGGMTSVDITKTGINKGYGINKLRDTLGISIKDMLFIGDALFPGGNDYPAKEAGVFSIHVRDSQETKRVIEALIACFEK